MAKFAAKGEPHSKQASEIWGSCMSRLQDNDQMSSAIKKAIIQEAGDRDMAAQETAGCTYSFVTVSLDNSRKVVIDNENQTDEVLQNSTIEECGKRSTGNSSCQGLSQICVGKPLRDFETYGKPFWQILQISANQIQALGG